MLGQPSVIARLMGLEDAAVPATPPVTAIRQAEEGTMVNLLNPSSGDVRQPKCSPLSRHGRINGDYYRYCLSKMKPRLKSRRASSSSSSRGHRRRDRHDRHHPQEELLEKIKEEFRASWQQASMGPSPPEVEDEEDNAASVSGRRSSGAGADRAGWVEVDGRYIQRVAQENLRREKMARYGHGGNGKAKVGDEDDEDDAKTPVKEAEEAEEQRGGSEAKVAVSEEFFRALGPVVNGENDEHHDRTSNTSGDSRGTPTRIAILRPIGATRAPAGSAGDLREPALGMALPSWKAARDGGSGGMEEFLWSVKERLNNELKAKNGNSDMPPPTTTRRRKGWGSEEAKGDTARKIREAVVSKEDLGRRLSRLESFRVFRGDRVGRCDATAVKSPEHRMLKSVRARIEAMSPKKTGRHALIGCLSPVSSRGGRARSSPPADAGHASFLPGIGSDEEEEEERRCCTGDQRRVMTTKTWKVHGAVPTDADVGVLPRALVRSLSAPAPSRVSDGGSETSCEGADAKLSRSRSFGHLRGTVASVLKRSFSLLLMHLTEKSPPSPHDSGNSIAAATQADFLAGLPPPSPVSPLDVHGRSPRHFSGGFSCTFLPESSPRWSPKCSSESGASVGGGAESPWRRRTDAAAESADDPDRVYIREVLIAAGLFHDEDAGPSEDTVAATIISDQVFDEVEDAYYYLRLRCRVDEDGAGEEEDGWPDRRRLLFHLANEALQALQAGPSSSSSPSLLRQWIIDSGNGVSSSSSRLRLRGTDLEDEVWRRVARAMTGDDDAPAPATTVDGMVEREVRKSSWMVLREDVCAVGRKVERAIFDGLVADLVRQVFV